MDLSMHILQHWFEKKGFQIQSSISNGAAKLKTARLTAERAPGAVVGIHECDPEANLIRVENSGDILYVRGSTEEDVLNSVVEAFDYYNAWETQLLWNAFDGASLQELLEIAHVVLLHPMLIQNSSYEIIAITESYGPQIHRIWSDYYAKKDKMDIVRIWYSGESFNAIRERATLKEPALQRSITNNQPFILANIFLNGVRAGHIVMYEHHSRFTKADLQIMKVFQRIVSFYINTNQSLLFPKSDLDLYMEQMIGSHRIPGRKISVQRALESQNWEETDRYAFLYFYTGTEKMEESGDEIENRVREILEYGHLIALSDGIGALINFRDYGDYRAVCRCADEAAFAELLSYGISQPFSGLEKLPAVCRTARKIAGKAFEKGRKGLNAQDAGLFLLQEQINWESEDAIVHPEYEFLSEYDRKNNTQLAKTLFWFLYCNRSYAETAEKMETHRNTVYYRVSKIMELIDPEAFESAESRLLYELSYLKENP